MARTVSLRRKLNSFDVTSLVVGSIIGADIYIAAAIGAKLVGPASIIIWVLAGIIAMIIALSFSFAATIMPRIGGPYAYAKEASNPFGGFIVGWSLLLAEWFSLAVFPVAFVQYFFAIFPIGNPVLEVIIKGALVLAIFLTNFFGIRLAGRFNDILTIAKLAPLMLLIFASVILLIIQPGLLASNFQPFFHGDIQAFGQAIVLIFWAYAGFELATLPADEIDRPERTIPHAIIGGMLIVIAFYLLTNFAIIGVVDQGTLASSSSPLMDAASATFGNLGIITPVILLIIGLGALISIMGADESSTIGTSRLAYAMSIDGLMPRSFGKLHKRFNTPYFALIAISLTAFLASVLGGLADLINASVFLLAFVYFATCLSAIILQRRNRQSHRPKLKFATSIAGVIFSIVLMGLVEINLILISLALLLVGVPIYVFFAPKKEHRQQKETFLAREAVLRRTFEQTEEFLAVLVRRIILRIYKARKKETAWVLQEESTDKKDS